MKITGVRYIQLKGEGVLPINPGKGLTDLDVYSEFFADTMLESNPAQKLSSVQAIYLEILTDVGLTGVHGALFAEQVATIEYVYKKLLIGMDPLAANRVWDVLYKSQRNGTTGLMMMALSAIDNALWDLRGKYYGQPVYRLLGGPTRTRLTAYASCYPELDFDKMAERAFALKAQGFLHQKWFFRYGPGSGRQGMLRNIEMVRKLREALGDDATLMFDGRRALDANYAVELIKAIEPYQPHWVEEPLTSMKLQGYEEIKRHTAVRIATGEHIFTRWHAQPFMEKRTADILQTDPEWCGGITELAKIIHMAEPMDIQVIPHGHTIAPAAHTVAAISPTVCPMVEYLPEHQMRMQFFLKRPLQAMRGYLELPTEAGLGYEWDETKILSKSEMNIF